MERKYHFLRVWSFLARPCLCCISLTFFFKYSVFPPLVFHFYFLFLVLLFPPHGLRSDDHVFFSSSEALFSVLLNSMYFFYFQCH